MKTKTISLVLAMTPSGGIGYKNSIPWYLPEDLKRFKEITEFGTVIMGRKTWESLPVKPLRNRLNIVLSKKFTYNDLRPNRRVPERVAVRPNLQKALEIAIGKVFIIGGAEIYQEALENYHIDRIFLTAINKEFVCDTFFNYNFSEQFKILEKSGIKYCNSTPFEYFELINNKIILYSLFLKIYEFTSRRFSSFL